MTLLIGGMEAPAPNTSRHADAWAKRGPEARAALLASALPKCRALAVQLADDERWCCDVERRLADPAFAHIPADDPRRVRAHEDLSVVRRRIDGLNAEFAHWRRKADAAWEEADTVERCALGLRFELGIGVEPWAMWLSLGDVLIGEYVRAGALAGPLPGRRGPAAGGEGG